MPFQIQVTRPPGFVRYDVAGPASLKNYFDLIDQIAGDTLFDRNALADLRGVVGRLHVTDQVFIGEVVAQKLTHLQKLAILVPEDPESYNSPRAAQGKGKDMRGFSDEAQALAWLTS